MKTKHLMVIVAVLNCIQFCHGDSLVNPRMLRALRAASDAVINGQSPRAALETLEAVAEGRPLSAILAAAERAGLRAAFAGAEFRHEYYTTRIQAMEMIGRTGSAEALDYLSTLTPEQVGRDAIQDVYPAGKVALNKAMLAREIDPERQISFLEQQLTTPGVGQVALWAQNELCDRGSVASKDLIQKFIKRLYSSPRGDEFAAFCVQRMDVVNRNPDRAVALASVLTVDAHREDEKIMHWAIFQLFVMHSAGADAALDRYTTEVANRYAETYPTFLIPESSMHRQFAIEIRRLRLQE